MKAFNKTWVENFNLKPIFDNWYKLNLIDQQTYDRNKDQFFQDFYQPNWYIRIGLFLFSCVAISFSTGFFFAIMGIYNSKVIFSISLALVAVAAFLFLEYFIKNNKLYRSGIDNAFLYAVISFLYASILVIIEFNLPDYVYPAILLIFLTPAIIRYADPFVSIVAFVCFFVMIFLFFAKYSWGKSLLPFIIMGSSCLVYYFSRIIKKAIYYFDTHYVFSTLSIVLFYLGSNYFIVREANALLNNQSPSVEIPLSLIFWFFTIFVPFVYIIYGAKTKERNFVIVGLLAIGFSIFTFRHYHSILPFEWALTLGGLVLSIVSIFTIKYFKTPKFNFSSEPEESTKLQQLESILVSQAFQVKPIDDSLKYGGGMFGGGGADESY